MNQQHFSGIPLTYDQLTSMLVSESCMRVAAETRVKELEETNKELEEALDLFNGLPIKRQRSRRTAPRPPGTISRATFLIMVALAVLLSICSSWIWPR